MISVLVFEVIVIVILGEVLIELDSIDFTIGIKFVFDGRGISNEVNTFISGRFEDFVVCSQILETSSESNSNSLSSESEGRSGTIQSSITNTKNDDVTVKFGSIDNCI